MYDLGGWILVGVCFAAVLHFTGYAIRLVWSTMSLMLGW
jgi:hypothetical protein